VTETVLSIVNPGINELEIVSALETNKFQIDLKKILCVGEVLKSIEEAT